MTSKLRFAFRDFLGSLNRLWQEMIGTLFLALTIMFGFQAFQSYREYTAQPERGLSFVFFAVALALLMLFFALQSFWKSRKTR